VMRIGKSVFYYCDSLTSITFQDDSDWFRTTNLSNWNNHTGGTQTDLTNASNNVGFINQYYDSYWYKL